MDDNTLVNRLADLPFKLDDTTWPSIEHYYQAMLFKSELYRAQIATAATSQHARAMGGSLWRRRIDGWRDKRVILMTRAVYIHCRTYPEVTERLLNTQTQKLVESSQYDYFWGCGRDQRGRNEYGKLLEQVRAKLHGEYK